MTTIRPLSDEVVNKVKAAARAIAELNDPDDKGAALLIFHMTMEKREDELADERDK